MQCSEITPDSRLPVWRALSELFLDTEIDEATCNYVARTVLESQLSIQEIEAVLWNEVFPVLHRNLLSPAGEWAGWSDEWLRENLRIVPGKVIRTGPRILVAEVQGCWERVLRLLPVVRT